MLLNCYLQAWTKEHSPLKIFNEEQFQLASGFANQEQILQQNHQQRVKEEQEALLRELEKTIFAALNVEIPAPMLKHLFVCLEISTFVTIYSHRAFL